LNSALLEGYSLAGLIRSPLKGPKGNVEFLTWLGFPADDHNLLPEWLVQQVLDME
jgi:hypothetical protein